MTFVVTALAFYFVWTSVQCYNQRDRLFLLQKTTGEEAESVLVATWKDGDIPTGCEILTDKEVVDNVISISDSSKILSLSEDDMKILLDDCSEFNSRGENPKSSMVEASTRMSIRDIIRNSYPGLKRRNNEDRTSQKQREGRRNSGKTNDSRVNDIETTTSLSDLKPSRRKKTRSTVTSKYSTESPRTTTERYPTRENARRTTIGRYSTEPTKSAVARNPARNNTRRTTTGRYSTETTRSVVERNSARDNRRRTTIGRYSTKPTRSARQNARKTTIGRYPAESTTRSIETEGTNGSTVRTTSENNIESFTIATSSSTVPGYNGIPIIMPGTKWCGAGDIAQHEKDFGRSEETDKCCKAHDHCNDTLAPGETRGNLTNDSSFTLLNCQCDEEFYECLYSSNSIISNTVGNMYFNILGRKCYKKDYPMVCKKYYTFFKITCREYESDTSQKRSYNWYPAKTYRKIFTK